MLTRTATWSEDAERKSCCNIWWKQSRQATWRAVLHRQWVLNCTYLHIDRRAVQLLWSREISGPETCISNTQFQPPCCLVYPFDVCVRGQRPRFWLLWVHCHEVPKISLTFFKLFNFLGCYDLPVVRGGHELSAGILESGKPGRWVGTTIAVWCQSIIELFSILDFDSEGAVSESFSEE